MSAERLQKILAQAGVSSRRKAEELIQAGRVRVDGIVVTELGTKADPRRAKIELDGKRLVAEPLVYGVLHKPRGMVSTLSDPEGRPTVRDILRRVGVRVVPVGRLDYHTSGVLLFTNDGEFAETLQHARSGVPKVYVAKVRGVLEERQIERWAQSIEIEGRRTKPADLRILREDDGKTWLQITLHEGRNRQVRRLGDHAGTPVMRLVRSEHAGITSEGLRPGHFRLLNVDELKALKKAYGVPKRVRSQNLVALAQRAPQARNVASASERGSQKKAGSNKTTRAPASRAATRSSAPLGRNKASSVESSAVERERKPSGRTSERQTSGRTRKSSGRTPERQATSGSTRNPSGRTPGRQATSGSTRKPSARTPGRQTTSGRGRKSSGGR